eukprot:scaffold12986_cov148-Isochrysis_galbana.AAC.2
MASACERSRDRTKLDEVDTAGRATTTSGRNRRVLRGVVRSWCWDNTSLGPSEPTVPKCCQALFATGIPGVMCNVRSHALEWGSLIPAFAGHWAAGLN